MDHDITLYKRDVNGTIREWSISSGGHMIVIHHGVLHGAMTRKVETVDRGKGGRSLVEQVESRVHSRVNSQLDKGYVHSLEKAKAYAPTNTLGFLLPMLAQRHDKVQHPKEYYEQLKYDGNRCLIVKENGEITAYSRKGKKINSIDHILKAVGQVDGDCYLDGELYHHGTPLNVIRSWVSRKQANTEKLTYICYDIISPKGYAERLQELRSLGLPHPIEVAPTTLQTGAEAAKTALKQRMSDAVAAGYEGLILRKPDGKYETGKRSKNLIKVKLGHLEGILMEQDEFMIVDMEPSKDGWAILVCACGDKQFKVSAPGSIAEKQHAMDNKRFYLGKLVTVEFAGYTEYDRPFQPVALAYRGYHE